MYEHGPIDSLTHFQKNAMKAYRILFILNVCATVMFAAVLPTPEAAAAVTITNVAVDPNPFSPNGDGVRDVTTIRFVVSEDPGITKIEITFDKDKDGRFEVDDLVKEVPKNPGADNFAGENKLIWDGGNLAEGAYQFQIKASGDNISADAFGSVIIDREGPAIENVIVSLSPFSPNGDGINDVTEIVFDLSDTNPPGFGNNFVGSMTFSVPQGAAPSGSITLAPGNLPTFPFGVMLVPIPDGIQSPFNELEFFIQGGYKGALVSSRFRISPEGILDLGTGRYDTISSNLSDLSVTLEIGATSAFGTASLKWFTGSAVVNIYLSNGRFLESLPISPTYIGDGRYHVSWEPSTLSDGVYIYRIIATDGTGNVSQRSGEIIIANSTLEISNVQTSFARISPEKGDKKQTVISYELSQPSLVTFKIFDGSGQLVRTLANGIPKAKGPQSETWDGKDNSDFVSPGSETSYTYLITAVDSTTSDTAKASGTIIVDNKPPAPPLLDTLASQWTSSKSFEVTGTAEAGATVRVFVGTISAGVVQADTATGAFRLSNVPLNVGVNRITALASDSVGNASSVSSNAIAPHFDETAPVTVVENLPSGWQRETVTVKVIGRDELGGSGIAATYYTTDGSPPNTASPRVGSDGSVKLERDGIFQLRFFSVDNAGNTESVKQASSLIRIDSKEPEVKVNLPQPVSGLKGDKGTFFGNTPIIIISGVTDDGPEGSGVKLVEIQLTDSIQLPDNTKWVVASGTLTWQYSFIPDVLLNKYAVWVRATDNAGNKSEPVSKPISLEAPAPTTKLTATPISAGRIRLTWPNVSETYNLYRATFSQFVPDDKTTRITPDGGVKGGVWIDEKTTDQTEYHYKLGKTAAEASASPEAIAIADKTPPAIENISSTPNPFSPNNDGVDDTTTISFTLTEETFVTLNIYDTDPGDVPNDLVRELVSRVLAAGDNLIEWNGRKDNGDLAGDGIYVYQFQKASTLDASGNTLLQDISGSINNTLAPPLELKVLEAQPNPFSPNGDRINDVVNLNYTLSDFADFVAVNILDTTTGQPKTIASLKVEALTYFFNGENWAPVHVADGIPPGRSDENYFLTPVDARNATPPPFGLLNKPADAQTIDGYIANYQANNTNWRPVPFTISWGGEGATKGGAYIYQIGASKTNGISAVPKAGVILLEGIVVVPDDKTPPVVVRTQPPGEGVHSAQLTFVSADLDDAHGTGADLTASTIRLIGPNGTVPGRQSNDGIDTITWTLNTPLADDGSADGSYTIVVSPVDFSKNRSLEPLAFAFTYNSTLSDETPPEVIADNESPLVMLTSGRGLKLTASSTTLIDLDDGEQIESIQATVNDEGSGINLAASAMRLLTSPGGTLIVSEKREAPIDRFSGKLLLRKIAIQFDGTYALQIQPVDNAGNAGETRAYLFNYKTLDDRDVPTIPLETLTFTPTGIPGDTNVNNKPIPLTNGVFIATPIAAFSVELLDPAPSVGFNLNPPHSALTLLNASGESVRGRLSYSNPVTTPDGTVRVKLNLTLDVPLQIDGSDDGDYTVKVTAEDNSGNASPAKSVPFKYDTIKPAVSRISLPNAKLINQFPTVVSAVLEDTPKGSGIAPPSPPNSKGEGGGSVLYLLAPDGSRVPARTPLRSQPQGTATELIFEPDPVATLDGVYTIVVIPKDRAGNQGAKVEGTFLLDKSPPAVTGLRVGNRLLLAMGNQPALTTVDSFVNGEVGEIQITLADPNGIDFQNAATTFEVLPPPESIAPKQPLEGRRTEVPSAGSGVGSVGASPSPEPLASLAFQLTVPLSINGIYTIQGKIADRAGNVQDLGKIQPPLRFTYDNRPPDIGRLAAVESGTGALIPLDSGGGLIAQPINAVTADVNDVTAGVEWTQTKIVLKDGEGVAVPGALQQKPATQPNPQTIWLLNNPSQLQPGLYSVEVEATDKAGNKANKRLSFGFSQAAQLNPRVISVTPKNGERLNLPIRQVRAVVQDQSGTGIDFQKSSITVTGPKVSPADSTDAQHDVPQPGQDTLVWNFSHLLATDGSDDGEYTVTILVVDKAGNRTEPPPTVFFYDTTPPTVGQKQAGRLIDIPLPPDFPPAEGEENGSLLATFPEDGAFLKTSLNRVSVTLTDPAGIDLTQSSIKLQGPTGPVTGRQTNNGVDTLFWEFASLRTNGSQDGEYQISVQPVDAVGNKAALPLTFTFTYDTRAPIISQSNPKAGATVTSPIPQITVTLDDRGGSGVNLAGSVMKVFKSDAVLISAPGTLLTIPGVQSDDGVNTLIWTLDRPLAADGTDDGIYRVEVMSKDTLGNTVPKPETLEFTYTVRAPALVSTTPGANARLNEPLNRVVAVLRDRSGTGLNLTASTVTLRKVGGGANPGGTASPPTFTPPTGTGQGGSYTLTFILDRAFASNGSDDGTYTIQVTGVDNAGSAIVYNIEFVYDTVAPRVLKVIPISGNFLNRSLEVVSAQLADDPPLPAGGRPPVDGGGVDLVNSTIQLIGPSGPVNGRQTNNGSDTIHWEFAPLKTDSSGDGRYTIRVVPVDTLGNRAVAAFESQFYLDTLPPTVSTDPAPQARLQIPIRRVSARLDDDNKDRGGRGADLANSHIQAFGPSGAQVPGTQGNDGKTTLFWEFNTALADDGSVDGAYTIEVISQDLLGNRSIPLTFPFEYRSKTPLLDVVTPKDRETLNTSIARVSARLIDQSGTGLNLAASQLTVVGAGVSPEDVPGNNGTDTLFWTFANPLATDGSDDGKYTVTITAAPNVGGRATYTTTFTYDTTAPVIVSSTPPDGAILQSGISQATVTLADAGVGVDLRRSSLQLLGPTGNVPGRQTNNGVDTLQLAFDPLSVDGEHTLVVVPWDVLGNTLPTTRRLKFLIDRTAPSVVSTIPAAGATIVVPIDQVRVTLRDVGAGVDGEKSTVRLAGPNGFAAGDLTFSLPAPSQAGEAALIYTLKQPFSAEGTDDGMYEIIVSPVDKAGNATVATLRFPFTYTTKAPGVVSSTPQDGATLNKALESVSVTLKDNSGVGLDFTPSQITLIGPNGPINGLLENDGVRTFTLKLDNPFAIDGRDDGAYQLNVTAFDRTGAKAQYTRTFTYDTTPPTVTALRKGNAEIGASSFAQAGGGSAGASPSLPAISTPISFVEAVLADKGVGVDLAQSVIQLNGPRGTVAGVQTNHGVDTIRWEFRALPADGSADGVYTLTVTPKDKVGNVGTSIEAKQAAALQFVYDTLPPRVVSTLPKSDSVRVTSIDRVAIVLDDGAAGTGIDFARSTVTLTGPNGNIPGTQTHDGVKTLFLSFAALALDETAKGRYQIAVTPQDGIGNRGGTQTFSFTYQPTAPILADATPPDGAKLRTPPRQIQVKLTDQSGTGVNFERSWIQLVGPKGLVEGQLTSDGKESLFLTFNRFLATDGTDDGAYTIRVFSVDNRQNEATHVIGFTYDTTPPQVVSTIPAAGALLNKGFNRVVARLVDAQAGVDLTKSEIRLTGATGTPITGEQQNNGADTIQLQFATIAPTSAAAGVGASDGIYTITVKPMDVLENTTPEPIRFQFRLDTLPPRVVRTDPLDNAVLVNMALSRVSAVLSDGNGSGVDLSQSTIQLTGPHGEVKGTLTPGPSPSGKAEEAVLTLAFQSPLSVDGTDDGRYIMTIVVVDPAGNRSEPYHASYVYDTIQAGSPTIQDISVQPAAFSPNGDGASDTTRISYVLSSPARVTIRVADDRLNIVRTLLESEATDAGEQSIVWDGTGGTPIGGVVLPDGMYTLTFDAKDANGLTGALESVNVVIDTLPPILSRLTVSDNPFTPDGDGFADVVRIQFEVSNSSPRDNVAVTFHDALGNQIAISPVSPPYAGDGVYTATWNGLGAPTDGEYGYTIRVRDSAANVRTRSGTVSLDRDGPTLSVVEPAAPPLATNQTPLRLSGNVMDFSGIRKVEVLVRRDDATVVRGWQEVQTSKPANEQISKSAPIQWSYEFAPPSDGTYTFTIRATDNVGHTASPADPVRITYDTSPPKHTATSVQIESRPVVEAILREPVLATNGETVQLMTRWDAPGYRLTADFSQLDTGAAAPVTGTDTGGGEYLLKHQISTNNRAPEGLKTVRITAIDSASNQTTIEVQLMLDNTVPRIVSVRSLDADTVYRNGETISLQVTADASDYVISADFRAIDQNYQPKTEQVTNLTNNNYTIQYQIRSDNPRPDGKLLAIAVSASDGVLMAVDKTFTVELDNTVPLFTEAIAAKKTYSNGESVVLSVTLDAPGYTLAADFSELDSTYTKGAETALDNGNKTYTVRYLIGRANTKGDVKGSQIRLEARDVAGNQASRSLAVVLDNIPPKIQSVRTGDADRIYKNGDTVNIIVETDSEGYVIKGDFSFVDSKYEPGLEKVTDQGDGSYRISYPISSENAKAVGETLATLPVRMTVSDGVHTVNFDTFTIDLDNQPPLIEISRPAELRESLNPFPTTSPEITILGKTEPHGSLTVAPVPTTSNYNADTGAFSFMLSLNPGENSVQVQATDTAGNKTIKTLTIRYNPIVSTAISSAAGGTAFLPEETDDGISDNDTRVIIPPRALTVDGEVTITRVTDGLPAAAPPDLPAGTLTPRAAYRITLRSHALRGNENANGKEIHTVLKQPATLVLQFPAVSASEGGSAGASPPRAPQQTRARGELLSIFKWDGVHWNNFGGTVQANNTVLIKTADIVGTYAIYPVSAAPQAFKVRPPRPNPFTPNGDGVNDVVTLFFDNPLGASPMVRIYDIRGRMVRELLDVGLTPAFWDGRDDAGQPMPSGIYLYQVKVGDKVDGGTVTLAR